MQQIKPGYFLLCAIIIFIEGILFYLQRRLSFEFGPLALADSQQYSLIKYLSEYSIMRVVLSIPIWFIARMRMVDLTDLKKVIVFNAVFYGFVLLLSFLFYPMFLLQTGSFRIRDIIYVKLFNLFSLLLISSLITPMLSKTLLKSR